MSFSDRDSITVGGRVFHNLSYNFKILRGYVNGSGVRVYSCLREENSGCAFQVASDEIFLILAIKYFGAQNGVICTYGFADEDAGLSSTSVPNGFTEACYDANFGSVGRIWAPLHTGAIDTNFKIPSSKYPCISLMGNGMININAYGYIEKV